MSSNQVPEFLLAPSLAPGQALRPLFSPRAAFFTAFFGGPLAATMMGWSNLRRAGRPPGSRRLVALGILLTLFTVTCTAWAVMRPEAMQQVLGSAFSMRSGRYFIQAMGLGVWGLFHLRLRALYRAAELAGHGSAPPWRAGLAFVGAAIVLQLAAHVVLGAKVFA